MRASKFRLLLCALMFASLTTPGRAQCEPGWITGSPNPGNEGFPYDLFEWDPDGSGPRGTELVAGGYFRFSGNFDTPCIARFDGTRWLPLGDGISYDPFDNSLGFVYAMAAYKGRLIASGYINRSGTTPLNGIGAWDGQAWSPLAQGLNGKPVALEEYAGDLYAAGAFWLDESPDSFGIAKWNGTAWSRVAPVGIDFQAFDLEVYGGELILAGEFGTVNGISVNGLARWNGTRWTGFGIGPTSQDGSRGVIRSLAVRSGELIVSGNFASIDGVAARNIARFDGTTWRPLSSGISGAALDMVVRGNDLFICGITEAGGVTVSSTARWNGESWFEVPTEYAGVQELALYRGDLVASNALPPTGGGVARLVGTTWKPIGPGFDNSVSAFARDGGSLVAVGDFTQTPDGPADYVARWDGVSWSPIGGGFSGPGFAATIFDGQLIAGGNFIRAGNTAIVNGVARFDGSKWLPMSVGFDGPVYALTVHNGELYAGGAFKKSGTATCNGIARWTGSNWAPLGIGVAARDTEAVLSLRSYNGELFVGGAFTSPSNPAIRGIGRWNGMMWRSVATGVTGSFPFIYALEVFKNELVAAGSFESAGGAPRTIGIARWNGTKWNPLGQGLGLAVIWFSYSLAVHDGNLYVGGAFDGTPTQAINAVARWDGASWSALGVFPSDGVRYSVNEIPTVRSLASFNGELQVGGVFTSAGAQSAGNWSRWSASKSPWISRQPEDAISETGGVVTLAAAPARGYDHLAWRWTRNGVAIGDGPGGAAVGGGVVSGAAGQLASPSDGTAVTLTITGVNGADAGSYAVDFFNDCSTVTSRSAAVIVLPDCDADFDGSGFVDTEDFDSFVRAYESGDPSADINASGFVDTEDFDAFVRAYEAGC